MRILVLAKMLLLALCGFANQVFAEPREYAVDVQIAYTPFQEYFIEILRLSLDASKAPNETIQLRFATHQYTQARLISTVEKGQANDLIWLKTSLSREEKMRAIRVPLLKGLSGYRVLVIRKSDQEKFSHINAKAGLLALVSGQGTHWPDTDVLRENHYKVVEGISSPILYAMLRAKRFDFFPRGVAEVALDAGLINQYDLMIEPRFVLHYPSEFYFFVNKKNSELAERLEKGLNILIKNGTFEKIFFNNDRIKYGIDLIKQPQRKIIELSNPFMTQGTPVNHANYGIK